MGLKGVDSKSGVILGSITSVYCKRGEIRSFSCKNKKRPEGVDLVREKSLWRKEKEIGQKKLRTVCELKKKKKKIKRGKGRGLKAGFCLKSAIGWKIQMLKKKEEIILSKEGKR